MEDERPFAIGTWVKFTGQNGPDYEIEAAKRDLVVGKPYKVVGTASFIEVEGSVHTYNATMFEPCPAPSELYPLEEGYAWIGFSLSFCVKDILDKKVNIGDVLAIITGTNMPTGPDFTRVAWKCYGHTFWRNYDEVRVVEVLGELYSRIVQPRGHVSACVHTTALRNELGMKYRHWIQVPIMRT